MSDEDSSYFNESESNPKREHHNALERQRRDNLRNCFVSVNKTIPTLQGRKASRSQILIKTADYLHHKKIQVKSTQEEVDVLKRRMQQLQSQIASEAGNSNLGTFSQAPVVDTSHSGSETSDSDSDSEVQNPCKKLNTGSSPNVSDS